MIAVDDFGTAYVSHLDDDLIIYKFQTQLEPLCTQSKNEKIDGPLMNRDGTEMILGNLYFKDGEYISKSSYSEIHILEQHYGSVYDTPTFENLLMDNAIIFGVDGKLESAASFDLEGKVTQLPNGWLLYNTYEAYGSQYTLYAKKIEEGSVFLYKPSSYVNFYCANNGYYYNLFGELYYNSYHDSVTKEDFPGILVDENGFKELFIL